jgi:hypothetical protein
MNCFLYALLGISERVTSTSLPSWTTLEVFEMVKYLFSSLYFNLPTESCGMNYPSQCYV